VTALSARLAAPAIALSPNRGGGGPISSLAGSRGDVPGRGPRCAHRQYQAKSLNGDSGSEPAMTPSGSWPADNLRSLQCGPKSDHLADRPCPQGSGGSRLASAGIHRSPDRRIAASLAHSDLSNALSWRTSSDTLGPACQPERGRASNFGHACDCLFGSHNWLSNKDRGRASPCLALPGTPARKTGTFGELFCLCAWSETSGKPTLNQALYLDGTLP
jgi:hypothetical protein